MGIGHGKIILLGEHSVVYGRPALAASLGVGCRATAIASSSASISVESGEKQRTFSQAGSFKELGCVELLADRENSTAEREALRKAFVALLNSYEKPLPDIALRIESDLPGGAGLGCSAAMGVAATRAIDELVGLNRNAIEVAQASMAWERVFHGTPSGIDSAMAAQGGIAVFYRGKPLQAVDAKVLPLMVIGHSGESASTRSMVEDVAHRHAQSPDALDAVFDAIAELVFQGRDALETGDLVGFGRLMDRNQLLLERLKVSTDKLQQMCEICRGAGALGAKLTGGGGGGCMIALVADEQASVNVINAINGQGYQAFAAQVGVGG
jgi:mevalonate kinase